MTVQMDRSSFFIDGLVIKVDGILTFEGFESSEPVPLEVLFFFEEDPEAFGAIEMDCRIPLLAMPSCGKSSFEIFKSVR